VRPRLEQERERYAVSIYLSQEEHERLRQLARLSDRSMSKEVLHRFRKSLMKEKGV
jgi:hypothetical protein